MSRLRLAKISTPSAPPSTTAELFYSLADAKLEAVDENGNVAVLGGFAAKDYRLIRVFLMTASGTYTPTTGARALYVECGGGQGGGGGCAATSSNASAAGGGGGGNYAASWLTGIASSYSVTIGASGANGAAGANAGFAGGDTIFGSNVVVAKGGGGGAAGTTPGTSAAVSAGGQFGGSSGNVGDVVLYGSYGSQGVVVSGSLACAGAGGLSPFLMQATGSPTGAVNLWVAGSGTAITRGNGCGAAAVGTQAAIAGIGGCSGLIRIWEFA